MHRPRRGNVAWRTYGLDGSCNSFSPLHYARIREQLRGHSNRYDLCFLQRVAPGITFPHPIRLSRAASPGFFDYLRWLAPRTELIVVDGSHFGVFAEHSRSMPPGLTHCPPDYELTGCANGKV